MSSDRKNCLLIVFDCLRADKTWGTKVHNPFVKKLTENGVSYTETITSSSTTSPCFASLLTGLYPPSHGIRSLSGFKLKSDASTLPQVLKNNGYHTYAEVTGPLLPEIGLNKGFDQYNFRDHKRNVSTDWFERIIDRFEQGEMKQPWFLMLHLFELHEAHKGPSFLDRNPSIKGSSDYEKVFSYLNTRLMELLDVIDIDKTLIIITGDHGHRILENKIDEFKRRIKDVYRRTKMKLGMDAPKTSPVVGHGFQLYDPLIKVPLILSGGGFFPQSQRGNRIKNQIRQIDIFPTIAELLGLEFDSKVDGDPLVPLKSVGNMDLERRAYMEACGAVLQDKKYWRAGVRTNSYKYIWAPYNEDIPDELYNLEKDPSEDDNIANERPQIANRLRDWGKIVRRECSS